MLLELDGAAVERVQQRLALHGLGRHVDESPRGFGNQAGTCASYSIASGRRGVHTRGSPPRTSTARHGDQQGVHSGASAMTLVGDQRLVEHGVRRKQRQRVLAIWRD